VIGALFAVALAAPPPLRLEVPATPRSAAAHATGDTRCSACHTTASWTRVSFDHSKTGFPLEGRHLSASCNECHTTGDFNVPVATSCSVCHRDVHTGEFGTRCAGCHDARDWSSRFDALAHQRTNFPLTGRHAAIPCEECHLEQRDRRFTRATLDCFACHQADYLRTAGTALDHARAGFSTDCKSCHFPTRFKNAVFVAHRACFQIDAGPHANIACFDCHTSLAWAQVTGACATNTAACTRCHTCPSVQAPHAQVAGFQCKDRKCYECHTFTNATGRGPRGGGPR
jgi:hypothetical protein